MNPFAVIERGCAEFVERSFARVFPSRLEPVQVARRLVAVLEAADPPPTRYRVALHPHDLDDIADELGDLCASWEEMLEEMASRMQMSLSEHPRVEVVAEARNVPGSIAVTASGGAVVRRLRVLCADADAASIMVRDTVTVGRAADSDLTLMDPSISRRHARFVLTDGVLRVTDLGSTNGTFVDERRVETAIVHRGDVVRLGDCKLSVE